MASKKASYQCQKCNTVVELKVEENRQAPSTKQILCDKCKRVTTHTLT
jgi:hypothetical protein